MSEETDALRKSVYEQDCVSWRHQDSLQWGRFQTAATIEAGLLYGIYQSLAVNVEKFIFAIFAALLVFLISLLAPER